MDKRKRKTSRTTEFDERIPETMIEHARIMEAFETARWVRDPVTNRRGLKPASEEIGISVATLARALRFAQNRGDLPSSVFSIRRTTPDAVDLSADDEYLWDELVMLRETRGYLTHAELGELLGLVTKAVELLRGRVVRTNENRKAAGLRLIPVPPIYRPRSPEFKAARQYK